MNEHVVTDARHVHAYSFQGRGKIQLGFPVQYMTASDFNSDTGMQVTIHVDELVLQDIIDTATNHIAQRHEAEALLIDADSELQGNPKEED